MPKQVDENTILSVVVGTHRDLIRKWDGVTMHPPGADEDVTGTFSVMEDDTHRISGHHPFTTFLLEFKGDEGSEEYDEKVVVVVYTGPDL